MLFTAPLLLLSSLQNPAELAARDSVDTEGGSQPIVEYFRAPRTLSLRCALPRSR